MLKSLNSNISTEWNEDLGPVLRSFSKNMMNEMIPIAQEFLYDEEIPPECLQSIAKLSAGVSDRKLRAMRCK